MSKRIRAPWWYRTLVVLVVLLALGVASVFAWFYWWTPRQIATAASDSVAQFQTACSDHATETDTVIATLRLPGSNTDWPVTASDDVTGGLSWYQQTARPGHLGNMVVVGQRLIAGGPLDSILDINVGDPIVVQVCDMRYTYTVVVAPRDLTVQPADTWVLDPVPGEPSAMPTEAWLTLIANQDIVPSADRAVGFARLTSSESL